MLLPHLPFLHFHGEEPRLGMVMTPVSGLLHMIMCVCTLGQGEGTVWWKVSGRLDLSSGTLADSLGGLREVNAPISLSFPISYNG